MTITAVTPADIAAIAALARIVWQETYREIIGQAQIDSMLAERYNTPRLLDELASPGIWWDQIHTDGVLAGFASSLLTGTAGEMKLDKLYIDPAQQRLGLGARLMVTVSERARVQGCHTLLLAVNKRNEHAIAAYRKNGFAVRESVCVEIGNGFVMDDFIMAKSLVPAAD